MDNICGTEGVSQSHQDQDQEPPDVMRLSFFSQPDGPVMGNGAYKSSVLVPGKKEAIYFGPPSKEKLPKFSLQGSVLLGAISYGKLSYIEKEGKDPQKNPVSYQISYIVPPNKVDEDKGKGSSSSTKSVSERVEEEIGDVHGQLHKLRWLSELEAGMEKSKV